MRPLFVGGTSSNAGKSWMVTAICAWLRQQTIDDRIHALRIARTNCNAGSADTFCRQTVCELRP